MATDSQQTCVKMCLREMYTAAENGRCKRKSRLGKSKKTMGEGDRGTPTLLPLHQEPGKKSGKPGQVWFNQTYQAFVKKTSLVKSLVRLVLPGF